MKKFLVRAILFIFIATMIHKQGHSSWIIVMAAWLWAFAEVLNTIAGYLAKQLHAQKIREQQLIKYVKELEQKVSQLSSDGQAS